MSVSPGEQVEVVVASGKGGVGKSTLTAVLAVELARRGLPLVVADADAEAPNLHIMLGVDEWDSVEPYYEGRVAYIRDDICTQCGICREVCPLDAVEVVDGKHKINPWICEGCLTCSLACPVKAIRFRFRVVAGRVMVKRRTSYGFPLVSSEIVPGRPNSGKLVTEVKNRAKSLLAGAGFVLVDAAAGIGCQVISSLTGAKIAILVAEPTPASLSDLQRIHRLTQHFMVASALVVNKYDVSREGYRALLEYAESNGLPILGAIPYDDAVPRAAHRSQPLHIAEPDSPAARAMVEIAEKVAGMLADWRGWWAAHRPRKPVPYIPKVK